MVCENWFWNDWFLDWNFSRKLVAIWEHAMNSTPYRLYANGSVEGSLSSFSSGKSEIILGRDFWP